MRLTTKLTTGTGPEIEPKTSRANSDVFGQPQLAGLLDGTEEMLEIFASSKEGRTKGVSF